MTENSKRVFYFLKDNHDCEITAREIAEKLAISVSAVTGSVNGLVRAGRAVRNEVTVNGENGKAAVVNYITLTDAGMEFDPEAEEARKAAEKARKAAEKAAEKAAK